MLYSGNINKTLDVSLRAFNLVLSDGMIVAKCNHENLLSQCKIYSKMWLKEAKEDITYNAAQ